MRTGKHLPRLWMADPCDTVAMLEIHEMRFSNKIIKHTSIDFMNGIFYEL